MVHLQRLILMGRWCFELSICVTFLRIAWYGYSREPQVIVFSHRGSRSS